MCLNGLKCSQNAGKLHSESTKFEIFLGEHAPQTPLVKLVQITQVKSWIHPRAKYLRCLLRSKIRVSLSHTLLTDG